MVDRNEKRKSRRRAQPKWILLLCLLPFMSVGGVLATPIGRVWMYVSVMQLASENSRIEAVQKLGDMGPVAAPGIRAAMHDENQRIRLAALIAIKGWGKDTSCVAPELVQLLDDDAHVKSGAGAWNLSLQSRLTLERLQGKAIPALIDGLKHNSSKIRKTAAAILGNLGPKALQCVPPLLRLLDDHNHEVRESAAHALRRIAVLDQKTSIKEIQKRLSKQA
ncbi:MAG: HEAT repeat domain-containing protein [Planctomycetota bacterium]|nr:HEAT repeat domain-containing protein [Planctomycetota bacterium]